jgi:predicted DNA-binding protein YlxM (UPF0122 family)
MARQSERNQQIVDLRRSGATLASIGAKFNLSRQAVHHIVKEEEKLLREYLEDMERLGYLNSAA